MLGARFLFYCDHQRFKFREDTRFAIKKMQMIHRLHRYRCQLSSNYLVESKMTNIERKFMLVGYCKLLSFTLLCLSLSEQICLTKCTGTIHSPFPFETRFFFKINLLIHSLQPMYVQLFYVCEILVWPTEDQKMQ